MKLGRRFIGADINLGAVQTTTKRILKVAADLDEKQAKLALKAPKTSSDDESGDALPPEPTVFYTGFEVYNVNHYDVFRNPVQAKELLMEALEIQPFGPASVYDGEKDGRMVKIMPVNRIATKADLNELIAGFDWKGFERRQREHASQPVEKILLVCMGHEPDLAATLVKEAAPFKIDVEVVDILRDKSNLEFKRDAEADIAIEDGHLVIRAFYPMNLLQKLSLMKEQVDDWRELVESVMVDWNYDGAVLTPAVVDLPSKNEMVAGTYPVPTDAGTIRVKITDLLSESLEVEVSHA
jgi:site-specific DNA-methyltransferase (adenine-specific)/adenine-specific DNA-methyltransferase